MQHSKDYFNDSSHFGTEPLFKKVIKVSENGDVTEVYEPLTRDEKLKGAVGCSMADLGDGFKVPDVSYLDKFQAMDLLEKFVDEMDLSSLQTEKVVENEE